MGLAYRLTCVLDMNMDFRYVPSSSLQSAARRRVQIDFTDQKHAWQAGISAKARQLLTDPCRSSDWPSWSAPEMTKPRCLQ